jgi:hypothetical protein
MFYDKATHMNGISQQASTFKLDALVADLSLLCLEEIHMLLSEG